MDFSGGNFMLILSRKKNESIVVNGNIRIVVVDVRGDKVQLGVDAPKDVPVFRSEVVKKSLWNFRPSCAEETSDAVPSANDESTVEEF